MLPTLHDSIILLSAPAQLVCGRYGEIGRSVHGVYYGDVRVISRLGLDCDATIDCVATDIDCQSSMTQRFTVRGVGEPGGDPEIILTRHCRVHASGLRDTYTFRNYGTRELTIGVGFEVRSDLANMDSIKAGREAVSRPPVVAALPDGRATVAWASEALRVTTQVPHPPGQRGDYRIPPGGSVTLSVAVDVAVLVPRQFGPVASPEQVIPEIAITGAGRLERTVERSLADLRTLLLAETGRAEDVFLAAGAPWFLTLFGRDSIWAARLALPVTQTLAMGTLRVLARRQARDSDRASQAEPGKILHEVRETAVDLGGGVILPPLYYGSIDSTLLWVSLLHDAWRFGAPATEVEPLLPNLAAALEWMSSAVGADGFIRYVDSSGHGLANQGWKDSADGIRHKDGTLGVAPIALCEVQAYAYAAATEAAAMQRHFGMGDPDRWEEWAAHLAQRFRAAFWVDSPIGPHPAVALDATSRPVSALTSNIGHLLGTGICAPDEAAQIARVLMHETMDSGYGLRTMASNTSGYNPLGYHTGSIWPHDTMIVARGLFLEGFRDESARLARGILKAATAFDHRLPEVFGGFGEEETPHPVPYPPSCRPQAWSSASIIEALRLLLGLEVDIPAGLLRVAPRIDDIGGPLAVKGLRAGGHLLSITVDATGQVHASTDSGFPIATGQPAAGAFARVVAPRPPEADMEIDTSSSAR